MRHRSTSTSTSSMSHEDRIRRPYKEDYDQQPRSRSEEERDRLRREWLRQQKLAREHEKLKQEKIIEYEIKRARVLQLGRRRRSKSRSRSADRQSSENQGANTVWARDTIFNGPDDLKMSLPDMVNIQVVIHNKDAPISSTSAEIMRDLINPTDLIVPRRLGEGAKPIFEREELKPPFSGDETEGQRRIVTVDSGNTGKTQYSKRRSASMSPTRDRTYSSHRSSSYRSRRDGSKDRDSGTDYYLRTKSSSESHRSRERSPKRRDRFKDVDAKRPTTSRVTNEESCRRHEDRRDHGRSKERESRNRNRDSSSHRSSKGDRSYREYRESSDRLYERWRRERSPGSSSIAPSHYIEQVPVPIYYGPRPMMVGPMMPYRAQVPLGRGRPTPVMGPGGPFRQRFVPPNMMYRLAPPPNPRFGPYNSY